MLSKFIKFCKTNEKDLIIAMVIILVGLISFGLGRLSKIRDNKPPITIENVGAIAGQIKPVLSPKTVQNELVIPNQGGMLVGSKNGSKYHYPWCSGALRIKEENKIWFSSMEEAQKAGYTPASNCKGLK